ncbi:hypothetical protein [Agrobacterium pusense]|uniref:hypothetical protein n=1 Tax=Agrobacterium pusense TaxID=648995 RepID=UPI0022B8AF99|nr:hypothetical protein [Agrobacterium pusense]MCZ7926180.1 hypothetical protein [Agrobacterium pusense]
MADSIMFLQPPVKSTGPKKPRPGLSQEDIDDLIRQGIDPSTVEVVDEAELSNDELNSVADLSDEVEIISPEKIEKEAPASFRVSIAGLTKPEDIERAVKARYPDAQPWGDQNYVMTDPDTGETIVLNQEGWIPSWGDVAQATPEIVGGVLGTGGSILGAAAGLGAASLPAAAAGAGIGYGAGKDLTQRGLNLIFGNQDTRDVSKQALDSAIDVGTGAAAEIGGQYIGRGIKSLGKGISNKYSSVLLGGQVDDAAKAAERLATYEAAGIKPTPGMIGGENVATTELARAKNNNVVRNGVDDVSNNLVNRWQSLTDTYGQGANLSRAEAGEIIQDSAKQFSQKVKANNDRLFANVADLTQSTPAAGTNLIKTLDDIKADLANASNFTKRQNGKVFEDAIASASALTADIGEGANFAALKEARTAFNDIAFNTTNKTEEAIYRKLAMSLKQDMDEVAAKAGDEAIAALKQANSFFGKRMGKGTLVSDRDIKKIIDNTAPESVFNLITSGSRNNSKRVGNIMQQVKIVGGDDAVRDVGSTVFNAMGRNKAGEFQAGRLISDWQQMTPEAKAHLFNFKGGKELRTEMDNVVKAFGEFTKYQGSKNHSNTAGHIGKMVSDIGRDASVATVGASLATGNVAPAVGIAGLKFTRHLIGRAQDNMFRHPETLRWMAGIPKAKDPATYIDTLKRIGAKTANQALNITINDYLRGL